MHQLHHRLLAAATAFVAVCLGGAAHAVTITPAPVLGAAAGGGAIGFGSGAYGVSSGLGTQFFSPSIYIDGAYDDLGDGEISATLGSDPAVLLTATPASGYGSAFGSAELSYQVEYFEPGAPIGATVAATIDASDTIIEVGDSAAEAIMAVTGPTPINLYNGYNCSSGLGAAYCTPSFTGEPNTPLSDKTATMTVNTPYTVFLEVETRADSPVQVLAEIDPTFSAPASAGGKFVFSPGVASAAPEPSVWAMMLVGLSGAGLLLRASRRRTDQSAPALSHV